MHWREHRCGPPHDHDSRRKSRAFVSSLVTLSVDEAEIKKAGGSRAPAELVENSRLMLRVGGIIHHKARQSVRIDEGGVKYVYGEFLCTPSLSAELPVHVSVTACDH